MIAFIFFLDESLNSKQNETFITYHKVLNDRKPTTVIVTHISSPFCFYVQENLDSYRDLELKMQKYYSSKLSVPLKNLQVGQICVAKYSEDNAWYRATITQINHEAKKFHVFFVDYGNEDVLPMDEKNICEITDEFKKHPTMGLKCSLKGLESTNKNGHVDFIYLTLSDLVFVRFIGHSQDFYYVDVTFEQKSINGDVKLIKLNDYLISNGYATSLEIDEQVKAPGKLLIILFKFKCLFIYLIFEFKKKT